MITEKKNQHYVPKFYLKGFSFKGNKKQIGVYNINNKKFIKTAKLKTQASKNFFYGHDGVVEDKLSKIERNLSIIINYIIKENETPKKKTDNHITLLAFIILTDLRNPVSVNKLKNILTGIKKTLYESDPESDIDIIIPSLSHNEIIELLLSQSPKLISSILDLDFKLLVNKTTNPFITSDFPVVKYNQFLEKAKWQHSKSGYNCVGLQIIIPLNSKLALLFFDPEIYKVGDKKKKRLDIYSIDDIDSINILQFINCFETIFFDEYASEIYVKKLAQKSQKYKSANEAEIDQGYLLKEGENQGKVLNGKQNLLILGSSDCECKLDITGIKIHSKGKKYEFNQSIAQVRPHSQYE